MRFSPSFLELRSEASVSHPVRELRESVAVRLWGSVSSKLHWIPFEVIRTRSLALSLEVDVRLDVLSSQDWVQGLVVVLATWLRKSSFEVIKTFEADILWCSFVGVHLVGEVEGGFLLLNFGSLLVLNWTSVRDLTSLVVFLESEDADGGVLDPDVGHLEGLSACLGTLEGDVAEVGIA